LSPHKATICKDFPAQCGLLRIAALPGAVQTICIASAIGAKHKRRLSLGTFDYIANRISFIPMTFSPSSILPGGLKRPTHFSFPESRLPPKAFGVETVKGNKGALISL